MNHLLRSIAPISDRGWKLLDDEATERLSPALAARQLVEFSGPNGWDYSAANLGRVEPPADSGLDGIEAVRRRVQPLVELRTAFTVSRAELRDADRGATDVDLGELDAAAQRIAHAENRAVFHGLAAGGIAGITETSSYPAVQLSEDFDEYPGQVAKAVEQLLREGVDGPYGLALGPACYTGVIETTEHGGYLVFDHLRKILGGPLVRAPGVDGAVVVSLRGGDFVFEAGQDLSIGYESHDEGSVRLYLEESFTFHVATEDAAVAFVIAP